MATGPNNIETLLKLYNKKTMVAASCGEERIIKTLEATSACEQMREFSVNETMRVRYLELIR